MTVKSSKDKPKSDTSAPFEEVVEKKAEGDDTAGDAETIEPEHLKIIKDLQKEVAELGDKISVSVDDDPNKDIKEDFMEAPAVFFAFSSYYAIYGDKKHGHQVMTPYERPFKFKRLYRTQRPSKTGRGVTIISVSQCIVNSRKEYEWLKGHSLLNIKFFESIKKAHNVDAVLAEKMAEANSVISSMNDHQILQRAQREEIDIVDPDITYIRQMLTRKFADRAIKAEEIMSKGKLQGERDDENRRIEHKKIADDKVVDEVYN